MGYHDHPFFTEQFQGDEAALREANALVFTASDMEGWTEEDHEAAMLAMDRDMAERQDCWRRRAETLAMENEALRAQLEERDGGSC